MPRPVPTWSSSPASNRRGASTSGTTSGRSGSTSRARTARTAIYCIVDLHAITIEYDPAELRERVHDTSSDPDRGRAGPRAVHPLPPGRRAGAHRAVLAAEPVTALGELNRMHQFRDKSVAQRQLVSSGLLLYPVLQAADVLAYRADEVPVGEDQREHLELMRDVARRFNARFGELLVVPEHPHPEDRRARARPAGARSARCRRPAAASRGRSTSLDEPDAIRRKFKRAVTDSGSEMVRARGQAGDLEPDRDPRDRRAATGPEEVERTFEGLRLRRLQDRGRRRGGRVADAGARAIRRAARRRGRARGRARGGAEKARAIAAVTLADVRDAMGVGPARRPSLRGT